MSTIPAPLARVIADMEEMAGAEPRFEADVRLLCAGHLRLLHQAATEAAMLAESRGHHGAADGFGRIARLCRAAAERIAAPVPVRCVTPVPACQGEPR